MRSVRKINNRGSKFFVACWLSAGCSGDIIGEAAATVLDSKRTCYAKSLLILSPLDMKRD